MRGVDRAPRRPPGRDCQVDGIDVGEDRRGAGVHDHVGGGAERQRRGDDLVPRADARRQQRQVQRRGARVDRHRVRRAGVGGELRARTRRRAGRWSASPTRASPPTSAISSAPTSGGANGTDGDGGRRRRHGTCRRDVQPRFQSRRTVPGSSNAARGCSRRNTHCSSRAARAVTDRRAGSSGPPIHSGVKDREWASRLKNPTRVPITSEARRPGRDAAGPQGRGPAFHGGTVQWLRFQSSATSPRPTRRRTCTVTQPRPQQGAEPPVERLPHQQLGRRRGRPRDREHLPQRAWRS